MVLRLYYKNVKKWVQMDLVFLIYTKESKYKQTYSKCKNEVVLSH